jgi:hypothetical protein
MNEKRKERRRDGRRMMCKRAGVASFARKWGVGTSGFLKYLRGNTVVDTP